MTESARLNRRRNRWKFVALLAVFVAPLLAAVAWFYLADQAAPPADTHGELIEPARPLAEFGAGVLGGGEYDLADLRGHWTMIHVVDDGCAEACRERMYYTRQIRDALGHDRVRVRRVAVMASDDAAISVSGLLPEHPDLAVLVAAEELLAQLPERRSPATVLVVDPLGNLMMRFDAEAEPEGIRRDLERLLRISRIG